MTRRRIAIGLGVVVLLLAGAATVFALTRPGDVTNADVAFRAEPTPTPVGEREPARPPAKKARKQRKRKPANPLAGFRWEQYGYSQDRRRYLNARKDVRPPFRFRWNWDAGVLLEFPPIIVGERLFTVTNDGRVFALDAKTGKRVWSRDMGYLAASSPAYGDGRIYVTILERERGVQAGRVTALDARTGDLEWSRPIASRTESSPLYDDGRVFFGAEDGTVYALGAGSGGVAWTYRAEGAVKGGLALEDGKLYFGAYGCTVYALWQKDGREAWSTGTSGGAFGLSAGNFYSTPAVAYGRVYIGNTDGNMYSFSSESGELAWRRSTGGYVYASPAVASVPGGRPTVYFGSYDGSFYALDARSGDSRWTFRDGGRISGAATVVGDVVYYSNWGERNTSALNARTGRRVWTSNRGAFNPVVSDGRDVFLTGFSTVASLRPKAVARKLKARRAKREKRRERRQDARAARERRRQ